MIVETMTHAEVYEELDRDRENLSRWMDRMFKECRRYALKKDRRDFPLVLVKKYTSPRLIHYGIIVIMNKRSGDSHYYLYVIRQTSNGKEVYLCRSNDESKVPKLVFIPHSLKRYAERTNSERTGEDLVRRMLIGSIYCAISRNQRIGSKSVRYKGEVLATFCTTEGAWLGKMDGEIFVINTFITYDMMCGKQEEELTKFLDTFMRGPDAVDDLILRFNNRRTLKTNQLIKR